VLRIAIFAPVVDENWHDGELAVRLIKRLLCDEEPGPELLENGVGLSIEALKLLAAPVPYWIENEWYTTHEQRKNQPPQSRHNNGARV
jgi:hypothetical protein